MNYKEIINLLKKNHEICPINIDNSPKIMDIQLLNTNIDSWNKNILYLGSVSNLNNKPNIPIMLISDENFCELPNDSNYSYINSDILYEVFRAAKDLIFEDLKIELELFELSQEVSKGHNIISIINKASSILGNAILLIDSNMKIITNSTNYEIIDPFWIENIKTGCLPYEFIQKLRSNKDFKQLNKIDREAKIINFSNSEERKLVSHITYQGKFLGSIIMFEHQSAIKNFHITKLPIIGNILFNIFNDNLEETFCKPIQSLVLSKLLNEYNTSDIIEFVDISKIKFPNKMYLVAIRFIKPSENRYLLNIIKLNLEHIFNTGYSVQYKSYIAILVPSISDKQKEELLNLAQKENVNIGISWEFNDIWEFKRYFNQAAACIKQAEWFCKTKQVISYTDNYFYDLLYNYKGKIDLKNYCNPALQILSEYDKANNSDLYNTLRIFLECNKNLSATADSLFIHRNSLTYRINRIVEITKLDLNDFNVIYSLIDSFRIDSFLKSRSKEIH